MNSMTPTFSLIKEQKIDSLNVTYQEYQHNRTSAKHIHLASDNPENVFLVALRTVPTDSTGVAHILEHTSLCGSKKYPVRDPFFMMTRRSLNTFMNAFTSSDWTAYPFASQSKKDFDNLLSVYLDAVFFARLDPLDFAQEGHRLEFATPDNPESELLYKGVVFNEMKGAMSSITSQLWQAIGKALFPNTTYGHNSGGEPEAIPDLSYEQLKDFYKVHYHPDNAVFMTFGDIPAKTHQEKFEQLALQHFSPQNKVISVPLQTPFEKTKHYEQDYQAQDQEQKDNATHQVMAWVIGDIKDPLELMRAHLLSSILLENSASPLQHALETTELGQAPSPLCGLDDSGLEMVFVCGLEGCKEDSKQAFEALIETTLTNVVENGVAQEQLEALLDQLELQQREISGDSYPYGLQLMLSCIATAMHRGEPLTALNIDPILLKLREEIQKPDFVKACVQELLLNNPHRATITLSPDLNLAENKIKEETKKLSQIKSNLDDESKNKIVETAKALLERQSSVDDPEVLPSVGLKDVPESIAPPASFKHRISQSDLTFYPQGTNGLIYQQIITKLPDLSEEQLDLLGLHNRFLTEVGIGNNDYLQTQDLQTKVCGSINAYSSIRAERDNEQAIRGYMTLSAKGLVSKSEAISELMHNTYHNARFDEQQRIAEMIAQASARAQQSVTGNGHSLAMGIACQGMSPVSAMTYRNSGILGIKRLKTLNEEVKDSNSLNRLGEQFTSLHKTLTASEKQFLTVAEEIHQNDLLKTNQKIWEETNNNSSNLLTLDQCRNQARELWLCNTQVNFCAKAYPTVTSSHKDAASLTVLAGVLRNNYLHTAIREQGGAYGGGASHDSTNATFRFYSYRDPRLTETLNDFDKSLEWLLGTKLEWRMVEEAILGVISSLDKPASPAGTAKHHFHNLLFGRTPEHHNEYREAVMQVTANDLKHVVEAYLQPEKASIGVITHEGEKEQYHTLCEKEDITIQSL